MYMGVIDLKAQRKEKEKKNKYYVEDEQPYNYFSQEERNNLEVSLAFKYKK